MSCPCPLPDGRGSLSVLVILEVTRRIRLEVVHHTLGRLIGTDDDVDMVGSHMACMKRPAPVNTDLLNRVKNDPALNFIKGDLGVL